MLVQTLSNFSFLNAHELSSSFRREPAKIVLRCERLLLE